MSCVFLFIFFHCRSFSPWWPLAFLIFPPLLENFHAVLPAKKSLLCLLSLALFLVELCWPVAYFLFFSVFQICAHDNYSKLNTLDNTVTETISALRFRLYWLFSSLLQKTRGYAIFPQSDLELPYLYADWVNLHWYARGANGRSRDYQNFSDA